MGDHPRETGLHARSIIVVATANINFIRALYLAGHRSVGEEEVPG
jgi:hypothetical protein